MRAFLGIFSFFAIIGSALAQESSEYCDGIYEVDQEFASSFAAKKWRNYPLAHEIYTIQDASRLYELLTGQTDLEETKIDPDWREAIVQAAHAPWAAHWYYAGSVSESQQAKYAAMSILGWGKYERAGGLEWLVAAALNTADWSEDSIAYKALGSLEQKVRACEATAEEFAALAHAAPIAAMRKIGKPFNAESFLPYANRQIRRGAALDRLYAEMPTFFALPRSEAENQLSEFREVDAVNMAWQTKLDMLQFYLAEKPAEIPLSEHAYVFRAYNFLSSDNLLQLAQRDPDNPNTGLYLSEVAFARYVALEEWEKAETLLPALTKARPDEARAIDKIWGRRIPKPVKLSLIIVHTPNLSSLIAGGDEQSDVGLMIFNALNSSRASLYGFYGDGVRNLPPFYTPDSIMYRDFAAWMAAPQSRGAFFSARSNTYRIPFLENAGSTIPSYVSLPEFPGDGESTVPFKTLIDYEEARLLSGPNQLMATVAKTIVSWIEQKTDSRLERVVNWGNLEADALFQLVYLCKFNNCGAINGKPAQQRAFELLHYRMSNSRAARKTKYWWKSPPNR